MEKTPKLPLKELLSKIDPVEAEVAKSLYGDYREIIESIPGATTKHQAWVGGYLSHVEEAMNIALVLYDSLSACRPVDCTLSDALFCVFLHDFDKVQRFSLVEGELAISAKYDGSFVDKTAEILKHKYHYSLSDEQFNALKYAHGEGNDHNPMARVMLPLATIVHCADIISARVWFDNGHSHNSWKD